MAKEVIKKLNTTKSSRDRYFVVKGGQGCYGLPEHYPDHKFGIVGGIDRGNGYQSYLSITYCLKECDWFPEEARTRLIFWLTYAGYEQYLREEELDMIREITIPVYSDPGHAWFKVPMELINQLQIHDNVSYCSYKRNGYAYLEICLDATFLVDKLKENGIDFKLKYHYSNKSSKIRSYVPFTQKELWKNPFKQEN